jgi:hypothetical protein
MTTKSAEQTKRNGAHIKLLERTNAVGPYRPFLRSLTNTARSSRTAGRRADRGQCRCQPTYSLPHSQAGIPATDMKARKATCQQANDHQSAGPRMSPSFSPPHRVEVHGQTVVDCRCRVPELDPDGSHHDSHSDAGKRHVKACHSPGYRRRCPCGTHYMAKRMP